MKMKFYEDEYDLAEEVFERCRKFANDDSITVIGDYWTIGKLLVYLCAEFEMDIAGITDFINPDYGDYDDAFTLNIACGEIFIEHALNSVGEPYEIYDDVVFIQACFGEDYTPAVNDDCDEVVLFTTDPDEYKELNDAPKLNVITDDNNKLRGFTFEDEKEGHCFSISLCKCGDEEIQPEKILGLADKLIKVYSENK